MKQRLSQGNNSFFQTPGGQSDYGTSSPETNPYGYIDHVVKSDETLGMVAKKYGISKDAIIKANSGKNGQWNKYDRSKNWLYKGESLKIPISSKEQYDIELIKRWVADEGASKSTSKTQTRPKAHRSPESRPSNMHTLDISKMQHHKKAPDFPNLKALAADKWHKVGEYGECSPEDLKDIEVYVFYIPDFMSQSRKLANDAFKSYGYGKVAMGYMKDAETFIKLWEQMDGSPEIIMLNTHGKNQSITTGHGEGGQQFTATGDKETNIYGTPCYNISDLPDPKSDLTGTLLHLNSCHSNDTEPKAHLEGDHRQGDLKGTMHTAAEAFLRRFPFEEVRATKESVNYTQWFEAFSEEWEIGDPYPVDETWEFMSLDSKRNIIIREEEID